MSKFLKVSVFALLAVAIVAPSAHAQTVAELQAQIQALLAQIQALSAQVSTPATSTTYTSNLTVGSKGSEVTSLQSFLNSKGFLTVSPTGYFGPMTQAALAKYQASVGISPAVGYFGPVTRAHFNSMAVIPTTPTTPSTPSTDGITTPGVEGILTVDTNPTPASGAKYYEADTNVGFLGLKVKAQNSDLKVERLKVSLGTSVTAYTKTLSSLSLYDGATLLEKVDLNSNTVVKEGTTYYVYFTNFSVIVPKDTTKVLTLQGDIYATVAAGTYRTLTLTVPANGLRAMDGAGVNQYAPTNLISRTINISADLTESATLVVSKNANSPTSNAIVSDTQGEVSETTLAAFDFKATNDVVKVDQVTINFSGATPTAAYLYDGSTLLGSASVSGGQATITDMEDMFQVAKDTTKTVTVKATFSGANSTPTAVTATLLVGNDTLIASNSQGVDVNATGSAASDTMYVMTAGPLFTLSSATASYTAAQFSGATGTLSGSFTFTVKAVGGDVYIATSTLGAFYVNYVGGTSVALATTSISYQQPTGTTLTSGFYKIAQDTTATFTVNATKSAPTAGSYYYFVMNAIAWNTSASVSGVKTATYLTDTFKTNSVYAQ